MFFPMNGVGGSKEYNVGGNCPDPYSMNYSNMVRQWPLDSWKKTTQFYRWTHPAMDLAANYWTPIKSVGYGFVKVSEFQAGGYGYHVIIEHPDNLQSLYAHMIQAPEVKVGDYVFPDKIIGYVGSTGKSSGPHLHFEILLNNCDIDPYTLINGYKNE